MKLAKAIFFAMLLAFSSGPAAAESADARGVLQSAVEAMDKGDAHEALKAAYQAMLMLSQQNRFHIRTAIYVDGDPQGYGLYKERADLDFEGGEPIHIYVEPGAFKYGGPDGRFDFGFTVDFRIATPDGNVLAGQDDFASLDFNSNRPNTEIMLDLTINLTGVPTGDYILRFTVHDKVSEEAADFELPLTIRG